MRRPGGAKRWDAMSFATFSASSSAAMRRGTSVRRLSGNASTSGSIILRQAEVLERVSGARDEIDPRRDPDPSGNDFGVGVGAGDGAFEPAQAVDEGEGGEIILGRASRVC